MVKPKVVVAASSPALENVAGVDWNVCALCQKPGGKLECPANNPVARLRNSAYESVGRNLEELIPFNYELDSGFPLEVLKGDRPTFAACLQKKKAKWHPTCKLKFFPPKLDALLKSAKVKWSETSPVAESTASVQDGQASDAITSRMHTRSTLPLVNVKEDVCFLCKKPGSLTYPLRRCATDNVYEKVKACAQLLNDTALLAILSEGDLVAIEAKYHPSCLVALYNRCSRHACLSSEDQERVLCEGIAFANLLLHIQRRLSENPGLIFQMGELVKVYRHRLSQLLGLTADETIPVHTTRIREKILAHFPDLIAQKSGREYILLKQGTNILRELHKEDQDEDALAAHFFLKNVRKAVKEKKVKFSGSFQEGCEEASIPSSLLAVINTLLYGSPVHTECRATRPALTICQLVMFNFHESLPKGSIVRHKREREPPLPVYLSLSAYGRGRDKAHINEMHGLGMSISYDRVTEITSQLCRKVTEEAAARHILCPANLKHGIPVIAAVDNIDVNPTSTTSCGSGFHGTGISIFQPRSEINSGTPQENVTTFDDVERHGVRSVPDLPDFYANVPCYVLPNQKPPCRGISAEIGINLLPREKLDLTWQREGPWLAHAHASIAGISDDVSLDVSWSGYHASTEGEQHPSALNALLPLFSEKSDDPATLKHTMDLVKNITTYLNGQQPVVICGDQPIFTVMKKLQMTDPDKYGNHAFVVLLGPLHIEKAFLKVLGQLLEGSGWVGVISSSGIATAGSAEGFLKVSHITKSRAVHQKTAVALFSLLRDAYEHCDPDEECTFEEWMEQKSKTSPTFKFWLTLLNLEILLLTFVRSIRKGDFDLYKASISSMIPFFFATNHPNYSKWLPVHLRDMEALPSECPMIHEYFSAGHFVVRKTSKPFSALGVDHAHEQNNASVKGHGGAVGLTEDISSLRRWTVGGPEVHRILREFEHMDGDDDDTIDDLHHEQTPGFQRKFARHCFALKESFLNFENPFLLETEELIALDTRSVASNEAVQNLYHLEEKGFAAFQQFVENRLVQSKIPVHDKISQIKCQIFTLPAKRTQNSSIKALKENVTLFSRLFIISQARQLDLSEFFRHENQLFPPALSLNGNLRPGNKSHLVPILEKLVKPSSSPPRKFDGIVFDGAALMYQKSPKSARSIAEYCDMELKPYLASMAMNYNVQSIAIAWDQYFENSIKAARESRGEGLRQQDLPRSGLFPKNWGNYLKDSQNKSELFQFLAERLVTTFSSSLLVTNVGKKFQSSVPIGTSLPGASCGHLEEADGRIIMHVRDMVDHGAEKVLVACSDTDVLVLGISFCESLESKGLKELWFIFGVGSKQRLIPAHEISKTLGPLRAEALRGFHSFSGCDSVSFFSTIGKPRAWASWDNDAKTTEAFLSLSRPLETVGTDLVDTLQKFTIKLYRGDSSCESVDEGRETLFCSGDRALSSIPPTKAALTEHIKRAAYQAGHIWGTCDVDKDLPPFDSWGWTTRNGIVEPVWSSLPDIWKACRELDRCGCGSDCSTQRCLCRRYRFPCCKACKKCKGKCSNASVGAAATP